MKTFLLKSLGALFLGFLLQGAVLAQTFFYLDEVTFEPAQPAAGEEICITVSGIKSTPCVYEEVFEVSALPGNELLLDMCFNDTSICIQILVPWDTTYCIPGLPAGAYNLKLGGCNYSGLGQTIPFVVSGSAGPNAGFSPSPLSGCEPLEVFFQNTSTNADSFFWEFGDGGTSEEAEPTHVYAEAGTYEVSLTATQTGTGQTDVTTLAVLVHAPPQVDLGPDTTITIEQNLLLNAGPGYTSYLWQDGSTTAFFQIASGQYAPGTYTFSVTVTNSFGCPGTDEVQVTITPSSAVEETGQVPFRVFPNPASTVLHLQTEARIDRVQWLDLLGRLVWEENDPAPTLTLPQVPNGTYLLKAYSGQLAYGFLIEINR